MKRLHTILLYGLGLSCLFGAGRLNLHLLDVRREQGITQADPVENAPPLVAFTTVTLGGFRGIIADLLWLRSSKLQEEGRYFELVQLADWITKLEPRFTEVWAYQAWNLAYNISVMFPAPEDRWRWVQHGIELLRNEGIRYNPGDARLLLELGWLYQHKIAGTLDDAHLYYKRALAESLEPLLSGARPDFQRWKALPPNREALQQVKGMASLLDRLRAADMDPWRWSQVHDTAPRELRLDPAWPVYSAFMKRETLERVFALSPETMEKIEDTYGPQDWRLSTSHSLYWAYLARQVARDTYEQVSSRRMIFQSLQEAFRRGRLVQNPDHSLFLLSPNLDVLPYVLQGYREAMAESENPSLRDGYRNFLWDAVFILYTYQEQTKAQSMLDELRRFDPTVDQTSSLDQVVLHLFAGRVEQMTQDEATSVVEGTLLQSLLWAQAGDARRAAGFEQLAVQLWSTYMNPRMNDPQLRERTGLPPLMQLRQSAALRLRESRSPQP